MSLNKISCWDILEIDVTRDKKTIKKAYAKLLRKNKPDEKPDEFKILYQAYEYALKYQANEQDSPSVVFDVEEQEDVFSSNYQKKLDEFVKKVNERTYQNNYIKLFNNVSNWSFIEELEIYEDIELYEEASLYLFEAVTEFENKFPKELLNMEVIIYFNDFFLWKKKWQKYDKDSVVFEYLYSRDVLSEILVNDYPLSSIKNRALAFSMDVSLIGTSIILLGGSLSITITLMYYIIFKMIVFWLMGLPTPGDFIFNLKVFEGHDKTKTTMTARGVRTLLIFITLFSLSRFVGNFPFELFSLVTLLNLGLLLKYNKLIQDFSGTGVYDMSGFVKD